MKTLFLFQLKHLTGSTANVYLEYIQRNLPEGVAMEIKKVLYFLNCQCKIIHVISSIHQLLITNISISPHLVAYILKRVGLQEYDLHKYNLSRIAERSVNCHSIKMPICIFLCFFRPGQKNFQSIFRNPFGTPCLQLKKQQQNPDLWKFLMFQREIKLKCNIDLRCESYSDSETDVQQNRIQEVAYLQFVYHWDSQYSSSVQR